MIFSPILVDFGFHFGPPAFRDSPCWASWAPLWRHLALSWAILRDLLRVFAPLGSIFGLFCSSWLHFWSIWLLLAQFFAQFSSKSAFNFVIWGPFFDDSGVARCSFFVCFCSFVCWFVCLLSCFFVR